MVLLFGFFPAHAAQDTERLQPVVAFKVVPMPQKPLFFTVGKALALKSIDVVMGVAGHIAQINFVAGQKVNKGDLLFTLATPVLDWQIEQHRKVEQKLKKQWLAASKKKLKKASVLKQKWSETRERLREKEQTRRQYAFYAPFDGIVGLPLVSEGAWVKKEQILTTLDKLDKIRIQFEIPENKTPQVRKGSLIQVAISAQKQPKYTARVNYIGSRIDSKSRSLVAQAVMDNLKGSIKPGMMLDIEVLAEKTIKQYKIPQTAVFYHHDQAWVYLLDKQTLRRQAVTVHRYGSKYLLVSSGLTEGDILVALGVTRLKNNQNVRIIDWLDGKQGITITNKKQ